MTRYKVTAEITLDASDRNEAIRKFDDEYRAALGAVRLHAQLIDCHPGESSGGTSKTATE